MSTLEPVIPTHTNGFCQSCWNTRYKVFELIIDGESSLWKKCSNCREETLATSSDNLIEIPPEESNP